MKQFEKKEFYTLNSIELEEIFGGEIVRVEYYENGVRKIKYVEI